MGLFSSYLEFYIDQILFCSLKSILWKRFSWNGPKAHLRYSGLKMTCEEVPEGLFEGRFQVFKNILCVLQGSGKGMFIFW